MNLTCRCSCLYHPTLQPKLIYHYSLSVLNAFFNFFYSKLVKMIRFLQGNITQSVEDYVCHHFDCVSTKHTSNSEKEFLDEFPFVDVYSSRKEQKGYRNFADAKTRDNIGTIKVYSDEDRDDDEESEAESKVVAMFTQYCPGKPFTGLNSKKKIPNDSTEHRLVWFRSCLLQMTTDLKLKHASVAFPYKIGCTGKENLDEYMDLLEEFADMNPKCRIYLYMLNKDNGKI